MASAEDRVATERDSYVPLMEHICCYLQSVPARSPAKAALHVGPARPGKWSPRAPVEKCSIQSEGHSHLRYFRDKHEHRNCGGHWVCVHPGARPAGQASEWWIVR